MQSIKQIFLLALKPNVLFWGFVFFFTWLVIEPPLLYDALGTIISAPPMFLIPETSFIQALGTPGGFVIYFASALSQYYSVPGLSSLTILTMGVVLSFLVHQHFKFTFKKTCSPVLATVTPFCMLILYSRYRPSLSIFFCVVLGLGLSLLFERWSATRPNRYRIGLHIALTGIVYALAGGGGLLVFQLMTLVYLLLIHRSLVFLLIALPVECALIWFLIDSVYLLPFHSTILRLTPWSNHMTASMDTVAWRLLLTMIVSMPMAVLLQYAGNFLITKYQDRRKSTAKHVKSKKEIHTPKSNPWFMRVRHHIVPYSTFIILGLIIFLSHDTMRKTTLAINSNAVNKQWPIVLEHARQLPKGASHIDCNHDINRALFHVDRLAHDLFLYPQQKGALLLTHEKEPSELTRFKLCDLFIELGNINAAEKLASELLATNSQVAGAIEKLAWINIVKERPDTARIYLTALRQYMPYRDIANRMLQGLEHGFLPEQQARFEHLRSMMIHDPNDTSMGGSTESMLLSLLNNNRQNRMAFEYLMSLYLLSGQIQKVIPQLERVKDFDYSSTPEIYQEAALIWYGSQKERTKLNLVQTGIQMKTFKRYENFIKLRNSIIPTNRQFILNQLIREYGNSYFFYYSFGCVGVL